MIRVALLDEHELLRIGLKTVLEQTPEIEAIADFGNSEALAKLVREERPELMVIDLSDKTDATKHRQRGNTPLLSERERHVMDLLVKGYTNREASEKLYLSPKTVEAYRAKIYTKLGVKTRADLFSYAVDCGLVAF